MLISKKTFRSLPPAPLIMYESMKRGGVLWSHETNQTTQIIDKKMQWEHDPNGDNAGVLGLFGLKK